MFMPEDDVKTYKKYLLCHSKCPCVLIFTNYVVINIFYRINACAAQGKQLASGIPWEFVWWFKLS